MDVVLRRRAVMTALRPYMNDDELTDALTIWQNQYYDKPLFAMSGFLTACCHSDALKKQRLRMLSSLLKTMDMPTSALLDDPYDTASKRILIGVIDEHVSHETTVFEHFFLAIIQQIDATDKTILKQSVAKQFATLKMDKQQQQTILNWLNLQNQHLTGDYDLAVFQQLVNYAYVAMCELYGPVKADKLLSAAQVESTPFAADKQIDLYTFL